MRDEDLCALEQLTYINEVNDKGGIDKIKHKSLQDCQNVGEYLNQFNLQETSDKRYSAIIEYMKNNEEICNLKVNNTLENKRTGNAPLLAYDFVSNDSDEHIVIFHGTSKKFEWKDNVEGLRTADTTSQREAADFINSIDSDNVTVVGHSKGGNKAMYCAIVCDNVKRCVSMDGQGFSDKFMEKYGDRIDRKAKNITNISYSADYVHALMLQIPGSEQKYVNHNQVESTIGCHEAQSIFSYYYNDDGNLCMHTELNYGEERESIKLINGFVEYFMHSDYEDKVGIIEYLGYLLSELMAGDDEKTDRINIDVDKIETIIAYLLKYCNDNNISSYKLYELLVDIKVDKIVNEFVANKLHEDKYFIEGIDPFRYIIEIIGGGILNEYKGQNYLSYTVKQLMEQLLNGSSLFVPIEILKNEIMKKYNNIKYNPNKKVTINSYYEKISHTNPLTNLREKSSPMMYYNLNGIQSAISKMNEAMNCDITEVNISEYLLQGESFDRAKILAKKYNKLHNDIFNLIDSTQKQVKSVYNAVVAIESLKQ